MLTRSAARGARGGARGIAHRRVALCAGCALLCMGSFCEPQPECEQLEGPFSVEVGMGFDAFHALEDDEVVDESYGSQGGTHLDGAARTEGLWVPQDLFDDPERMPRVTFQTFQGEEVVGGYEDLPRPFRVQEDGSALLVGDPVIFMTDASMYWGQTLRLSIDVTDMCGHSAHDERRVVLRDPSVEGG